MPENYLRLSELTAEVYRAINDRFAGRKFWVMADVTSHLYKADKRNHFFELVEKDPASGTLLAKIQAKHGEAAVIAKRMAITAYSNLEYPGTGTVISAGNPDHAAQPGGRT